MSWVLTDEEIRIWRVRVIWPIVLPESQTLEGPDYFLHFTIYLDSINWIASSHPTYNDLTSVVCLLDLLPTFSALSLSVSVIAPFADWWCRQEWHLSVRKETEQWSALPHPAICFWLQVAVSGCLLELQFGFLNCAIGSRSCAPHYTVFLGIGA